MDRSDITTFFILSLVFLLIGYIIRSKEMARFITGHYPEDTVNGPVPASRPGLLLVTVLAVLGVFAMVAIALQFFFPKLSLPIMFAFSVISIVGLIRALVVCRKYRQL